MPEETYIQSFGNDGVSFVGTDAIELFRAMTLASALKLLQHKIIATRGFTLTKGLAMATAYTGQTYKRTELARAIADLKVWIETMKSAIPRRD